MSELNICDFCNPEEMEWRTVRKATSSRSFVSNPSFRSGQCLVVPDRHVTTLEELNESEASEIMLEIGRLAGILDKGYGSGVMQKYQPKQAENGIKVNHLHFHVFPRIEDETGLFPVPDPNTFDGFTKIDRDDVLKMVESLK